MNVMRLLLKKYKRKINKVIKGGGILSILFALMISLFIPPFNINAETINSHVIGVNVWTDRIQTSVNSNSIWDNSANVHIIFELDDSYLGWANLGVTVKYKNYSYGANPPSWNDTTTTWSGNYYINGSSFEIIIPIKFYSNGSSFYQNGASLPNSSSSLTISYSNQGNVVSFGELSTLNDILNVLNDIYSHVDDLENNTSLINNVLNKIDNFKQWNIPFESYSFFLSCSYYNEFFDFYNLNNFSLPVFRVSPSNTVMNFYAGTSSKYKFIFMGTFSITNSSQINNYFSFGDNVNLTYSNFKTINAGYRINNNTANLISFDVSGFPSNQFYQLKSIYSSNILFIPIYFNVSSYNNVSTDFALLFGLSNELLDNLDTIAQGTNQSNQSSSNLENQKGSFDTTSNNLYTSENAFNTDMNNKLQSIDTSFNPSTSFGSKFLSSADWVRTQFNNLTSTSPFGTVLSFSMLLGLSLLIIGKVFK